MTPKKGAAVSFEKALERLEAIVEKLESEELGLDASLALFEEGIGLSRVCQGKLEEVERRVEIVLKEANGKYATKAFIPEDGLVDADEPSEGQEGSRGRTD
jgi:exodeoxyribonuclease VII small subunit